MTDYAYFFEINEITLKLLDNFSEIEDTFVDFNDSEFKKVKDELIEYFELSNASVLTEIQEILNSIIPDCQIKHIYLLGIKIPSRSFEFIIIHFTNENSNELQILRERLNLFLKLIDCHGVFIRKIRIFTNLFVNSQIFREFMEKYNSLLRKYRIKSLIWQHVNVTGDLLDIQYCFLFEIPVFTSLKIENLLRRTLKNYFKKFFPEFLNYIDITISAEKISNIFELSESGVLKHLFLEIRSNLFNFIWNTYRTLGLILYHFSEWLSNLFLLYQKFDTKTLLKLKMYFEEFKRNYYAVYPTFFIFDFDNFALNHAHLHSTGRIIYKHSSILNDYKTKYPDLLDSFKPFLVQFFRLKPILNKNLNRIDELIISKKDVITVFTKKELESKLNDIKNEQEFQELLAQLLANLECDDVKINCGTRGHSEHGKDIVFSNLNMFGSREWNAIVVKIGKIRAEEGRELFGYVKKIIDQGIDALETEFVDDKGSKFPITRVFIAANDTITDSAKESIRKKIEGQVFFIEKETLLNMCL